MRKILFFFTGLLLAGLLLLAAGVEPAEVSPLQPTQPVMMEEPTVQTQPAVETAEPTEPATEPPTETTEPEQEALFMAVEQLDRYNFELQQYVPSQTEIEGNRIRLTAALENGSYLSGKAESRVAFRYGTFSFRIRTTQKVGFFPAIWMLPTSGERYPEVDIYEAIGDEPFLFYGVIHRSQDDEEKDFFTQWITEEQIEGSYVLTFEWTEDALTWYMDGEQIAAITGDIPTMPMYMICNLAVGGNWAGYPSAWKFPEVYEIEILEFSPEEIFSR